jgi:hypothetical protein
LLKRLDAIVTKGREDVPKEVHLQTRTLRYPMQSWVVADALDEHWLDSRIDAIRSGGKIDVQTKNITRFRLLLKTDANRLQFAIDGQPLLPRQDGEGLWPYDWPAEGTIHAVFAKREGRWEWLPQGSGPSIVGNLRKHPGSQGPIDDAFLDSFLVVTPTGKSKNSQFQTWVDFELAHFRNRWRALMRAELPEKRDLDFKPDEEQDIQNLILWGDPDSNALMGRVLEKTPVQFKDGKWTFGGQQFDGNRFVPVLVYPRRIERESYPKFLFKYLVLNSGLTFREGHDRTNSQQNPKLPDWAVIDIVKPPDSFAPGRIHDAGFFDEQWQLKSPPKVP